MQAEIIAELAVQPTVDPAEQVRLRIDFLKALEAGVNTTAAQIGELEDRMERANLLPRTDSV